MDYRVIIFLALEAAFAYFLLIRAGVLDRLSRILVCVVLLCAAFVLRLATFNYVTADYGDFLSKWVQYFRINGGFKALSDSIGNYNIPYLYFLALFSYSSICDLYLIKLLSVFFDIILAWSVCRIVSLFHENKWWQIACFFTVLFWPTVFVNGALWGQCDSIYVAMAAFAVFLVLTERPCLGIMALAVSFGFKLQAVFIIPVFAVFLFDGKLKFRQLFIFPLTYILMVLPAVFAGRPFVDTVMLYFSQAGSIGTGLNYNSPSLFAFLDHRQGYSVELLSKIGIIAAFVLTLTLLAVAYFMRKKGTGNSELVFAALFTLGIPLLLPHMHDRYFYAADVLTLLLAFVYPQMFPAALCVEFASILGYYAYLKLQYLLLMKYGAIFNSIAFAGLAILLIYIYRKSCGSMICASSCNSEKLSSNNS